MFPTMRQHSDSKQALTSYLNNMLRQSCVVGAVIYRSGLKNADFIIRQTN
jgi:hypothetical protein